MKATRVSLESFQSSSAFEAHGQDFFEVEDRSGKKGIFDPLSKKLVVPCEFENIDPTKVRSLWIVTEFGRVRDRSFGSKGVWGLFDSKFQKLIIPTICDWIDVHSRNIILIGIPSNKYFRWWKLGVYFRTKSTLLINTTYEKDWIPQLPGVKVVDKLIPIATGVQAGCVNLIHYAKRKVLVVKTSQGVAVVATDTMQMLYSASSD